MEGSFAALVDLRACLQSEFAAALGKLGEAAAAAEQQAGGAGGAVDDAKAKAQREREERMKAEDEAKLAAMTPAQREKTLEKRRKKAEKAAAKAAKKGGKGGAGGKGGLGIGSGNAQVLQTMAGADKVNAAVLAGLPGALDVFSAAQGGSALERCLQMLETIDSGSTRRVPKIAKGTRDFHPTQMQVREEAFNIIRRVFKLHGAVEIDTPVFELKDTLTGKYGEDSKLIYDLADQGGEILALRYDLTVPFARYLAMHAPGNIKRFHMAKVYRRDNPQLARGRYREFYQCDFDVAGTYHPMVADAEVLCVAVNILSDLPIGGVKVKLNDRRILDTIFEICGCPPEKFRTICSAVDKLDKAPWEEVKVEMLQKGLDEAAADRIGEFVNLTAPSGEPYALLDTLEQRLGDHPKGGPAIAELRILFGYLASMGVLPQISLDMSLARGLDYYTGLIYECVLLDNSLGVGSIAAGGRYDNLVGMFSGQTTPCVGVSIGVERVFAIMERLMADGAASLDATGSKMQVLVASVGTGMLEERMRIAKELWAGGISAEFGMTDSKKLVKQLQDALERQIPYMVIIGAQEIATGVIKVKNMATKEEATVPRSELVEKLLAEGARPVGANAAPPGAAGGNGPSRASLEQFPDEAPVLISATKKFSSINLR